VVCSAGSVIFVGRPERLYSTDVTAEPSTVERNSPDASWMYCTVLGRSAAGSTVTVRTLPHVS